MTKKINFALLLLLFIAAVSGCKKDDRVYPKEFVSFSFTEKDEQGAVKEYSGTIIGDEIVVDLPTEVDVTNVVPEFEVINPRTIVQVGKVVQESGVSVMDFTEPVTYTVRAEDKSTKSYNVRFEKKIAIKSYGFFKEDNPSLTADYAGKIKGKKIEIGVPESIDQTQLVARFETTSGVVLKVSGADQESKVSKNNFTSEVLYSLNDAGLLAPIEIKAKTYILGAKWIMIGDENIIVPTASGIKMAIHPISNLPYLVYQRTGVDESKVAIPDAERKIAVIRYTEEGWEHLGAKTGVSDSRADVPSISFDQAGVPYISFRDFASKRPTVLKYVNSGWAVQGPKNFGPVKVDKQSFIINNNNEPVVSIVSDNGPAPFVNRQLYITHFAANQWSNNSPLSSMLVVAANLFNGLDGKTYLATMDRTTNANKLTMLKLNGNVWTPVGPTSFTTADNALGFTSAYGAADKEGQVYIIFQQNLSSIRRNRILKFNGSMWDELPMPATSESKSDMYCIATHPDGTLYYAYVNNSGLYFQTFNKATNNWNASRLIVSGAINGFDMKISNTGIPYLAVSVGGSNKTFVYKYTTE
ncbi:hypothetical protein [Desertivirga xinjiangensis]|uniref:hypothetical protein n=1 Tax=Desertivirga xinjiangensis TaxID=539206 RepID=UPI00210BBD47|nr:hypothetical protein [Pedobacter xinjiangensis]